jgi:protoporphyrinogen oxidase
MRVAILGAGLTGLSAAVKLAEAKVEEILVIEKTNDVGGMAASIELDGFIFDFGGHRFWTKNGDILTIVRDLLRDDLISVPRRSSIVIGDLMLNYPPDIQEFVRKMPVFTTLRCLRDYAISNFRALFGYRSDQSMWDWGVLHFGKGFFELYISTYTSKSWGKPADEISSLWAKQRIKVPEVWNSVIRAMINRSPPQDLGYGAVFYYPRFGIGTIARSIKQRLDEYSDIRFEFNTEATSLKSSHSRIQRILFSQEEMVSSFEPDFIISTIPLNDLVPRIKGLDENVAHMARSLEYRSMVFTFLVLDRPSATTDSWVYVPDPNIIFTRFYEPRNWSTHCVKPGMTSLCVEIHCDQSDQVWTMPEDEILTRVIDGLVKLGILSRGEVLKSAIYCLPHAYPMDVLPHFAQRAAKIVNYLNRYTNLVCAGRQGLYRYINMDHAIEMGFRSADYVLGSGQRSAIYQVAASEAYFENPDEIRS